MGFDFAVSAVKDRVQDPREAGSLGLAQPQLGGSSTSHGPGLVLTLVQVPKVPGAAFQPPRLKHSNTAIGRFKASHARATKTRAPCKGSAVNIANLAQSAVGPLIAPRKKLPRV